MVTSKWDPATGEVVVRCDAQTAHEVVKALARVSAPAKEVQVFGRAVGHTIMSPRGEEGNRHA